MNSRIRAAALVAATTITLGGWTGTAGAVLDDRPPVVVETDEISEDVQPAVRDYLKLIYAASVTVTVSPGGDVSAPSITGGVVAPPPPPPIVRDVLRRVGATLGIEGDVEISISRHGADVSAPSITGGVVAPPPPPPIVRDLLVLIKEIVPSSDGVSVLRIRAVDASTDDRYVVPVTG